MWQGTVDRSRQIFPQWASSSHEQSLGHMLPPRVSNIVTRLHGQTSLLDPGQMTDIQALQDHLSRLERRIHHDGQLCPSAELETLLHPDFEDIGRSGNRYDRATVLQYLSTLTEAPETRSDAFELALLSPGCALLTFRSAQLSRTGDWTLHTHRSSVWVRSADGQWQLIFHQGTATAPWA